MRPKIPKDNSKYVKKRKSSSKNSTESLNSRKKSPNVLSPRGSLSVLLNDQKEVGAGAAVQQKDQPNQLQNQKVYPNNAGVGNVNPPQS